MTKLEEWRESQIHEKGLPLQMKAEANLNRQRSEPFVEVQDSKTGEIQRFRRSVADRRILKGKCHSPRKSYAVPSIPGFTDK